MKALTIHQPWAWFIEGQHKLYETRSWGTRYRGKVALHAGRHWNNDLRDTAQTLAMALGIEMPKQLPLGAIVAVCELTAIYKADLLYPKIVLKERRLGNYEAGRYAWRLEVVEVLTIPIFCAGQQGLWECDLAGLRAKAIEASYGKV